MRTGGLAGNDWSRLCAYGDVPADCYVVKGLQRARRKAHAGSPGFDLGVDDLEAFDAFILELKDDQTFLASMRHVRSLVMDADDVTT